MNISDVYAVELRFILKPSYWVVQGLWNKENIPNPTFWQVITRAKITPSFRKITVWLALRENGNLYWSYGKYQAFMDLDQCRRAYKLIQDGNVKQRIEL